VRVRDFRDRPGPAENPGVVPAAYSSPSGTQSSPSGHRTPSSMPPEVLNFRSGQLWAAKHRSRRPAAGR